jgi:hypothetical protein
MNPLAVLDCEIDISPVLHINVEHLLRERVFVVFPVDAAHANNKNMIFILVSKICDHDTRFTFHPRR